MSEPHLKPDCIQRTSVIRYDQVRGQPKPSVIENFHRAPLVELGASVNNRRFLFMVLCQFYSYMYVFHQITLAQ